MAVLAVKDKMGYIDQLIDNCKIAKCTLPLKEFEFGDFSDLEGIKQAIYVIEQVDGNIEETFESFKKYKENKERKCAKLNSPSQIMYVGSSTTGIKNRIKQHQGKGHAGTYAIHLDCWYKGKYKILIKQYDVSREVLQIIEDGLSHKLKPAFGKQGGNNK